MYSLVWESHCVLPLSWCSLDLVQLSPWVLQSVIPWIESGEGDEEQDLEGPEKIPGSTQAQL